MNYLKALFRPQAADVEILFTRTCFVGGVQYIEGTRASFDRKTASEIMASGAAADPQADLAAVEKADSLQALLPPPIQPAPLPESWNALPESFHRWHGLNEQRAALITRMEAIEAKLFAIYTKHAPPAFQGAQSLPSDLRTKLFSVHVGAESLMENEQARYLKDALRRAEDTVAEWQSANLSALVKAQLECSSWTQEKHGELARAVRNLHGLGFELFAHRLAALGLHESQVERLYTGSTDFQKYATITTPSLQDLKLAWVEEGESPTFYVAQSPRNLAGMLAGYAATLASVATLTKDAERELAAARKVTAKAA